MRLRKPTTHAIKWFLVFLVIAVTALYLLDLVVEFPSRQARILAGISIGILTSMGVDATRRRVEGRRDEESSGEGS